MKDRAKKFVKEHRRQIAIDITKIVAVCTVAALANKAKQTYDAGNDLKEMVGWLDNDNVDHVNFTHNGTGSKYQIQKF